MRVCEGESPSLPAKVTAAHFEEITLDLELPLIQWDLVKILTSSPDSSCVCAYSQALYPQSNAHWGNLPAVGH